ncbi:MAG: hypothetical protein ACI8T1_001890 [Verrucomicrobiales bacterium]|jgi:hypothetical protein
MPSFLKATVWVFGAIVVDFSLVMKSRSAFIWEFLKKVGELFSEALGK